MSQPTDTPAHGIEGRAGKVGPKLKRFSRRATLNRPVQLTLFDYATSIGVKLLSEAER